MLALHSFNLSLLCIHALFSWLLCSSVLDGGGRTTVLVRRSQVCQSETLLWDESQVSGATTVWRSVLNVGTEHGAGRNLRWRRASRRGGLRRRVQPADGAWAHWCMDNIGEYPGAKLHLTVHWFQTSAFPLEGSGTDLNRPNPFPPSPFLHNYLSSPQLHPPRTPPSPVLIGVCLSLASNLPPSKCPRGDEQNSEGSQKTGVLRAVFGLGRAEAARRKRFMVKINALALWWSFLTPSSSPLEKNMVY